MTRLSTALFLLAATILLAAITTMLISLISAMVRSPHAYHWYMAFCLIVLVLALRWRK